MNVLQEPPCIDVLENRIASSVEHISWKSKRDGRPCHRISSKSFAKYGYGDTPNGAVQDFLKQNGFDAPNTRQPNDGEQHD